MLAKDPQFSDISVAFGTYLVSNKQLTATDYTPANEGLSGTVVQDI